MPVDPRTSGFFEQMGGPTPLNFSGIPSMGGVGQSPLQLRGGYRNVYGTRIGATYDPLTQEAGANLQFPVGDHQRQLFLGLDAKGNPQTRDWGATLSLTKRIAPRTPTAGEAINAITGGALTQPVSNSPGVVQADLRNNFMNSLTPEQLQLLGQGVKTYQRQAVDEALGIRQGAEKYGLEVGFSGRGPQEATVPYQIPGDVYFDGQYGDPGKEQLDSFIKDRKMIP